MYKGRDLKQIASHRTVMLAILVGMYLIWWDSFHEIGRFFMQVPLPFDFILSRYSSASCLIEPAALSWEVFWSAPLAIWQKLSS